MEYVGFRDAVVADDEDFGDDEAFFAGIHAQVFHQDAGAARGEHGVRPPAIVVAPFAANKPVAHHSVDQAGQPAAAEQHSGGEVLHAQLMVGRLGERHENVVPREWKRVLGSAVGAARRFFASATYRPIDINVWSATIAISGLIA